MDTSSKHTLKRQKPDTVAKAVPLRSRTEPERSDATSARHRLRNARTTHTNYQQSHDSKHPHPHRQAVKDTVQSALELRPPINFDHLLRRDKKAIPSRRNSGNEGTRADVELSSLQQTSRALKEHIDQEDVSKAREDNEKREEELRGALQQVKDQAMQSTRELDSTYYVLLEKAESLRRVVDDMQQLAKESRSAQESFQQRAKDLRMEGDGAIDNYTDFVEQENSIKALLGRLETYRSRTATLNERLDGARYRAEICEKKILHAQARRRKRWSIIWAMLCAVMVAILAVLIWQNGPLQLQPLVMGNSSHRGSEYISPFLASLKDTSGREDPYLNELFGGIL